MPTIEEMAAEMGYKPKFVACIAAAARPADVQLEDQWGVLDTSAESAAEAEERAEAEAIARESVGKMLARLEPREADVIRRRWGLGGGPEQTLEEIGEHYGLTCERVRQIERDAMTKIQRMTGI